MNIAWALLLSILIFVLLLTAFLVFLRSTYSGAKLIIYILRKHPLYSFLLLSINISILVFCVYNPFFFPLGILPIIFSFVRIYEFIDERFVDDKIGGWVMKQEKLKFQIIPNQYSNTSVKDMEKFFLMMHSMYGNRSEKGFRTTGKFFDEFSLEISAKDGGVNMYIVVYKSNLGTLMNAAKLYLPNVQFSQVPKTEIDELPVSYYDAAENWKNLHFGEFSLLKKEVFPTKFYHQVEHSLDEYKNNPITQLFNYLSAVKDGDVVHLQIMLRPQEVSKRSKELQAELAKVRKEFCTNSSVAVGKDGQISQLTPYEVQILQDIEKKICSQNFQTKIRFALLGKESTGKKYLGGIMTYLKIFATDKQVIIPKPKSWQESDNATWGPFVDTLYHNPEGLRKSVDFYDAMRARSMFSGGDTKYWDIYSLSTLFHIPSVFIQGDHTVAYQMPSVMDYLKGKNIPTENDQNTLELDNVQTIVAASSVKSFDDYGLESLKNRKSGE